MLNSTPLKNNLRANKEYARCAQNLIQCWNSLDEEAKRLVVADLNQQYGIDCDVHNHEVAVKILETKLAGDFKIFI